MSPRAPVLFFGVSLMLTLVTFWSYVSSWQEAHGTFPTLQSILSLSAYASTFFIIVAIITALMAVVTRNAPLPGAVVGVLTFLFVFGVLFMGLIPLAYG
jgi:hypothetical protein